MEELNNNKIDHLTSLGKATVGLVPFAGPILAEVLSEIVPNQRFDRLVKYVKTLDEKLSQIPIEKIKTLLANDEVIDLIEEGFVQASRAITDERREYIATIIKNGIDSEAVEIQDSKYLLRLLNELNDLEIIWLQYFNCVHDQCGEEFKAKHQNILTVLTSSNQDDTETKLKAVIQEGYIEHLERLKLIEPKKSLFDNRDNKPIYFQNFKKIKALSSTITELGKMLLLQLELT